MNRLIVAAVSAAGIITLSACSSSSTPSGAQSHGSMPGMSGSSMPGTTSTSGAGPAAVGPHNQADATFATDMIPHHGQAIEMAAMALSKASNAEVKMLATQIKAAQAPEIAKMSGWLAGWGAPVPDASMGPGMPGMTMPGMMSASDMAALAKASGAEFDKMWVQMMISHHTGAVEMAKTELTKGQNPDAKALAQSIITSQTAEIARLRTLLPTLGS